MCESFSFYSLQKTSQNPSLKIIIFLHFLNFTSNTTLQIGFWLLHKESPNDWWDLSPLKKDQSICDAPKLCFINHMKVYQAWNSTWNLIFKKPISIFFSSKSICIYLAKYLPFLFTIMKSNFYFVSQNKQKSEWIRTEWNTCNET